MTYSEYTRGEQVLTPHDVEYLFRKVGDDLTSTLNRLRSLSTHFTDQPDIRNKIELAVSNTISASSQARIAAREAVPHIFPHRQHAGEHEDW